MVSGGAGFGAVDDEGKSRVGWEVHHVEPQMQVSHDRFVKINRFVRIRPLWLWIRDMGAPAGEANRSPRR